MLILGTGPPPIVPLPADHWLVRLEEFRPRIVGAVAALDGLDADLPTLPRVAAEVEAKRAAFEALYETEHKAAAHLAGMIRQAEERAAEHEAGVRDALAEGKPLPVAGDVELVARVIEEQKHARLAAFPNVEQAGSDYHAAARIAAGSRALLLRLRREPERLEAERVLAEIREVDGRVDVARSQMGAESLRVAFQREGLL
jgi:hypothetical protein